MKFISQLTTVLFCSVITVGLTIPGVAKTATTVSNEKEVSSQPLRSTSTFKSNQNKQNAIKQSSQQLIGYWVGTREDGKNVELLLENQGKITYILTERDGSWRPFVGNWKYANGVLSSKEKNGSYKKNYITWISNNEFLLQSTKYEHKFHRVTQKFNQLNPQLSGTWSIIPPPKLTGNLTEHLISFATDGTYRYQKTTVYPALSIVNRQNVIVGNWKWKLKDYLVLKNQSGSSICRVYWVSSEEFVCIYPYTDQRQGTKERFIRTNEQIRKPELNSPLY